MVRGRSDLQYRIVLVSISIPSHVMTKRPKGCHIAPQGAGRARRWKTSGYPSSISGVLTMARSLMADRALQQQNENTQNPCDRLFTGNRA